MEWRPTGACTIAVAVTLGALFVAGCGDDSTVVVRTPTAPVPTGPSSSTRTPPPASGTSAPAHGRPTVIVTPSAELRDRQFVHVVGTGFSAGKALVILQCADRGTATGPGDCNLASMTPVTSDAAGRVAIDLQVLRGPFGGDQIICGPAQPCLISVTEASPTPDEEANAPIQFAGG